MHRDVDFAAPFCGELGVHLRCYPPCLHIALAIMLKIKRQDLQGTNALCATLWRGLLADSYKCSLSPLSTGFKSAGFRPVPKRRLDKILVTQLPHKGILVDSGRHAGSVVRQHLSGLKWPGCHQRLPARDSPQGFAACPMWMCIPGVTSK